METLFDWVSIAIFAALIVLFLQRSTSERSEPDAPLYYYLGAGVGCAVGDYVGNHGQPILAAALLIATVAFIFLFLKPFTLKGRS